MAMEAEFNEIDSQASWPTFFQQIRQECNNYDYTYKDAKKAENKIFNRYGDVSPYDHSRVKLKRGGMDYINANLVVVPAAKRSYILAQGPLPQTTGHFWQMVSEQNSKGVLMLNKVIEKNMVKCHQYFPLGKIHGGVDEMVMNDVGLKVEYLTESEKSFYTIRQLKLTDLVTGDSRIVQHYHYTTWPDFGVPQSPAAFLTFLLAVRQAGVLDEDVGPPVVHCSAGIGRSGTFCLVDSCLVLIEQSGDMNSVNIRDVLLDMRRYRMGLIQTADQLRFSYISVIEGAKLVLSGCFTDKCLVGVESNGPNPNGLLVVRNSCNSISEDDKPPPLPPRCPRNPDSSSQDPLPSGSDPINSLALNHNQDNGTLQSPAHDTEVRRRVRQERVERMSELVEQMKQRQRDSERWQKRRSKRPSSDSDTTENGDLRLRKHRGSQERSSTARRHFQKTPKR